MGSRSQATAREENGVRARLSPIVALPELSAASGCTALTLGVTGTSSMGDMRLFRAFRMFFAVLFGSTPAPALVAAEETKALPAPQDPVPAIPVPGIPVIDVPGLERKAEVRGALQLLALLQREGRLCDFLAEPIEGYADAQIGAVVRDIHRGLRRALMEHFPTEPVLNDREDAKVRVDAGFDPRSIRLTGQVVGEPPYNGTLRHHGWRVREVKLPHLVRTEADLDLSVVAPAEVEV